MSRADPVPITHSPHGKKVLYNYEDLKDIVQ